MQLNSLRDFSVNLMPNSVDSKGLDVVSKVLKAK